MSLLPKFFLDAVVSIEKKIDITKEYITKGSGFLIGLPTGSKDSNGNKYYKIFLVSNKHVFNDEGIIHLRFNKGDESKRYDLPLVNGTNQLWTGHPSPHIDIAVITIDANKLKEDGVEFSFIQDDLIATYELIKSLGISCPSGESV